MKTLGILSIAAALAFSASVSAETVTVANGNDYTPFTDEKLKRGGMASELVEEAFKAAGWTLKYEWLPWKRGYEMAKQSKIDAAMPWTHRAEREEFFLFSAPMLSLVEQVWTRLDSGIKSNDDLKGKTGCVPIGYSIASAQKPLFEAGDVKKDSPKDMTTCFKKLEAKRVDFVLVNSLQAKSIVAATIKQKGDVHAAMTSDSTINLHLLVGKGHPKGAEIIAAFNKGLETLKSSGNYEKIIASH